MLNCKSLSPTLYNGYRSVLAIGRNYAERMPGVFIDKNNKIWFYWNMDSNYMYDNEKKIEGITLISGKKYSFHFYTQKDDRMTLRIKDGADGGTELLSREVAGQHHNTGTNQPIYVGDNWYHPDQR